ncbi:methyltransferase domain-containing protein [Streptomyces sp. PmtG]
MSEDVTDTGRVEDATRRYYDSKDVDAFYDAVWGGEDIHTGIYTRAGEPIARASRRTVERVADRLGGLGPGRRVLDLGSGYGGTARHLAEGFGCQVVALNLSAAQNERHRAANVRRGLDSLIEVVTGSFHDVPYAEGHFDAVCSLEAFCHSGDDRARVLGEAARVLKPGGALAFTDIMADEEAPAEALRPAVSRLGVEALATPGFYQRSLTGLGLTEVEFADHSDQLVPHYVRLTEETRARESELRGVISSAYLDHLLDNLPLWADAARGRYLRWGVFSGRRP